MARLAIQINGAVLRAAKQYLAALRKSGLQIQAAYLYGSQAKGTANEWSDIDIAIVAPNLSGDWHDDLVRLNLVANQVDTRIEAVGYLPDNFRDESPLVWEIKTTGIPLSKTRTRTKPNHRKRAQRAKLGRSGQNVTQAA